MCFVSSVSLPLFESLKSGITELNRRMWDTFRSELMLSVILTAYNLLKRGSVHVLAFLEDHINPCAPLGETLLTFSMS